MRTEFNKVQAMQDTNFQLAIDLLEHAHGILEKLENGQVTIQQAKLGTIPLWRNGVKKLIKELGK